MYDNIFKFNKLFLIRSIKIDRNVTKFEIFFFIKSHKISLTETPYTKNTTEYKIFSKLNLSLNF